MLTYFGLTYLCSMLILVIVPSVLSNEDEKRLIRSLLANYEKRSRPVSYPGAKTLNVTFGLALSQLIDVDEKNQIITTNCWLNQAWIDHDLKWNPQEFGGLKSILIPFTEIWLPDILLYNNADVASVKSSAVSTNIIVTHTGNVTWLSMVMYKSSCTIDVRYFPFDEQFCRMVFASWTYDGSQLNLTLVEEKGDLTNYLPSSEFELVNLKVVRNIVYYSCCEEPYPDITYTVHIRRRPSFYVFNLILPCFLITVVALLGFWIPPESGEKVQMGITTLMAMTVFLMIVTDQMPPTSDSLPLIGIYYFTTIGIVSFTTAMTVFTLNVHHMGKHGRVVPRWLKILSFKILAPMLMLKLELPEKHHLDKQILITPNKRRAYSPNLMSSRSRDVDRKSRETSRDPELKLLNEEDDLLPSNSGTHNSGNGSVTQFDSKRTKHSSAETSFTDENWQNNKYTNFEQNLIKILKKLSESHTRSGLRMANAEIKSDIQQEWQQVCIVLDRLLLLIFVILTISVTAGLLIKGYSVSGSLTDPDTKS